MEKLTGFLCAICLAFLACTLPTQGGGTSTKIDSVPLSAKENHTLVLKSDATVWGWGLNDYGQVASLSNNDPNGDVQKPVQVTGLTGAPVASVAAGGYHSLALRSDGTVLAWGENGNGQLGDGSPSWAHGIGPVVVQGLSGVRSIAAGYWHSLALRNDGTVWAWGATSSGVLGDPSVSDGSIPVKVAGLSSVVAIAAGTEFNLALKGDGTVWAWGDNSYGQLGDGNGATGAYSATPVRVGSLTGVTAVSAGYDHALALKNDGTVWAWGRNDVYQCGVDYTGQNELVPVQVASLSGIAAIAAGGWHNLALKSDGTVVSWGSNYYRESGSGSTDVNILVPVGVVGLSTGTAVAQIAAGENHSIVLKSDGTLLSWGDNECGQVGDGIGTPTYEALPVQIGVF